MKKNKVGIFYDNLINYGGAEKIVLELAKILDAEVITSGFSDELNDWVPDNVVIHNIGNFSSKYSKTFGVLFETPLRFFLIRNMFNYDLNIYIGFSSIFAAKKQSTNYYYCFIPNKLFYDNQSTNHKHLSIVSKLILRIYLLFFKKWSFTTIKNRFSMYITQSKNAQNKFNQVYDIKPSIIYPCIPTEKYKFKSVSNFYLTVGRLFPEKRTNIIVNSFKKMKDKQLIIVGNGPLKNKISSSIKNYPNIRLLTSVKDSELRDLYSNCFATIYIPFNEDFGLIPIESLASGKICIAANEGGCKETIINNKNGYLIKVNEANIISTVSKISKKDILKMKDSCIESSKKFDLEIFKREWLKIVNNKV